MKITAIIAEYNPFHNGHLKQLRAAKRETDCDALVVLMSGSFTQRGDICVVDREQRARWAIEAGADLVLELPTVYTLANAKRFAEGAIKTLSMLGDYTLSFGTEEEELEELRLAAEFMSSESRDMSNLLKGFLSEGYSVAKSRTKALDILKPDVSNMLKDPNNILAVEYINAGAAYAGHINYHSVPRKPDDGKKYLSSTKIRERLYSGEDISAFVPEFVSIPRPVSLEKYNVISTYALKAASKDQLADLANISEGMENRISKSDFNTMEEFLELTSKRYTRSTIKRIAACATLGVTKELVALAANEAPYCTVLAVRPSKKNKLLPLLADAQGYFFFKPSDCPDYHPVYPLISLDMKADKIRHLCD